MVICSTKIIAAKKVVKQYTFAHNLLNKALVLSETSSIAPSGDGGGYQGNSLKPSQNIDEASLKSTAHFNKQFQAILTLCEC